MTDNALIGLLTADTDVWLLLVICQESLIGKRFPTDTAAVDFCRLRVQFLVSTEMVFENEPFQTDVTLECPVAHVVHYMGN